MPLESRKAGLRKGPGGRGDGSVGLAGLTSAKCPARASGKQELHWSWMLELQTPSSPLVLVPSP